MNEETQRIKNVFLEKKVSNNESSNRSERELNDETLEKAIMKEEMINTSVHSNNNYFEEQVLNEQSIKIIIKNNEFIIQIDKDALRTFQKSTREIKEKSLFKSNSIRNISIQNKTRRTNNTLDYDNFLKELYTPQDNIKVIAAKKRKKVTKLSVNKEMTKNASKRNNNINKNSSLFDLDNFIINSNSTKTIGKQDNHKKIFTPNYKLNDCKFYNVPNFIISKAYEPVLPPIEEDISDEVYLKYHDEFEKRERDFRINFYSQKKTKKSLTMRKIDYDNTKISKFDDKTVVS